MVPASGGSLSRERCSWSQAMTRMSYSARAVQAADQGPTTHPSRMLITGPACCPKRVLADRPRAPTHTLCHDTRSAGESWARNQWNMDLRRQPGPEDGRRRTRSRGGFSSHSEATGERARVLGRRRVAGDVGRGGGEHARPLIFRSRRGGSRHPGYPVGRPTPGAGAVTNSLELPGWN
jgi:hypothetical protein